MAIITPEAAYKMAQSANFRNFEREQVTEHFFWSEVFHNRPRFDIRSADVQIFKNGLKQAELMEQIRVYLRKKLDDKACIKVTSWWRSPLVNTQQKGAKGSMHLQALATDFVVPGYEDKQGNRRVQALLVPYRMTLPFSIEITNGEWTHIDSRPARIVFENQGNGNYKVWNLQEEYAFVKACGGA